MDQLINYLVQYKLSFVLNYQSDGDPKTKSFLFEVFTDRLGTHLIPGTEKTEVVDEDSYGTILVGLNTPRRTLEYIWKD